METDLFLRNRRIELAKDALTSGAGASNRSGSTSPNPVRGDGGAGGAGGDGGAGGNGDAGGFIELLVDRRFPEIEKQITLDVSGGRGGPGGGPGAGGPGCLGAPARTTGVGPRGPGESRLPSGGPGGDPGDAGAPGHASAPGHSAMPLEDLALDPIPGLETREPE